MSITSLTLAHCAIFRLGELVDEGFRIAARKAYREGNIAQAEKLLNCRAGDNKLLLQLMKSNLPDVVGPFAWAPGDVRLKSRKQLEMEIERAIFCAAARFVSSGKIAKFYGTNSTLVLRMRSRRRGSRVDWAIQ